MSENNAVNDKPVLKRYIITAPQKREFVTTEARFKVATYVANFLAANNHSKFTPEHPDSDVFRYCIDSGNDWRIMFKRDHSNQFELWYRYNHDNVAVESLSRWIAYQLRYTVTEEPF